MESDNKITLNINGTDTNGFSLFNDIFDLEVIRKKYSIFHRIKSTTTPYADLTLKLAKKLKHDPQMISLPNTDLALFELENLIVYISHMYETQVGCWVGAPTLEESAMLSAEIMSWLKPVEKINNTVPVKFWVWDDRQGPHYYSRQLEMPKWEKISDNYPERVTAVLEELHALDRPENAGRLILWHGVPGTGKSYAIRSLTMKWWDWCEPHFVLDPEMFFKLPTYMLHVLLGNSDSHPSFGESENALAKKWKLLIIEDSDEFLTVDAKERKGQSLSRLLNLADGLVGQGLNLLLLFTTNEEIRNIHPAISRVGRCMADVEFTKFNAAPADAWRKKHKVAVTNKDATLAELYEELGSVRQITHAAKNGFGLVRTR